jgi:hypothetical protein
MEPKAYHHELCQLCPKPFQFQHITTAASNHGLQPISFHQGINWDDHNAKFHHLNHEVESETPLKSLDPHQDDNELEGNKRELLSMILII